MSTKTIAQLFALKAQDNSDVLGAATGQVDFDNEKNRLFQLFEHGVIIAKVVNPTKPSHLTCTYGKLFHAWWGNPGAEWLGEPLEDLYETTNLKWDFAAKSGSKGTKSWYSASIAALSGAGAMGRTTCNGSLGAIGTPFLVLATTATRFQGK